jgi:hypothetical protein
MLRTITVTLAATLAVALGACGSGENVSSVTPETAKASVERAAQVRLAAEPIPKDAREQGLRAAYSNASTAVKDRQVLALFVLEDDDVADQVADLVRGSAPKSARLIVNGTVMVAYAPAGSDHGRAVERAVKTL